MTTPVSIPLHILEKITNGFSEELIIGRGGYGNVYKAVYKGEVIAVKLLHNDLVQLLDDRQFKNEVFNLLRIQHPNIVQLCGYCYETRYRIVEHNGDTVFGKHIYRVLCFEYLKRGSLDKHLHAPSSPPNWRTRYNTIKGICEGLNFLHGCTPPILHLDLKPANILLDSSMVPKVADLGLSKLFSGSHTQVTARIIGTQKYMPPEFINQGRISIKNDVFSLGVVMIEIMAGPMGYSNFSDMDSVTQFVEEVHTSWSTLIKATSKYPAEELHQVKMCINTAIKCVDSERDKRPTIAGILDVLNRTETHMPSSSKKIHIPQRQSADVLFPIIVPNAMTDEVDFITNERKNFNCIQRDSSNTIVQQVPDRETSSVVEPTLIIGRNKEKHKILYILSERNTEDMVILPIYGIGGIGKTTLAQLVYNDIQFQKYSRVWVYVSEKFDLKKIGNSIISQLTKETSHIADQQTLHNRLVELFADNSILIVLDDLWEQDRYQLDKLKTMLSLGRGTKVIVVTTRDEAIARKINSTFMPYKLDILTNDMCWTIIKQKSFFEDRDDKNQLENIGRDIAIKCGGVALAAQSLGYMLRDMESDKWESVRDSYIWSLSNMEDPSLRNHEVLLSLLLSYSHMNEFLQLCFSYCAVFPKGRNIVKYDLIHQWIALGLTGPSSTFDPIQLCEKYITELLGMSFLQHSTIQTSVVLDEERDKDVTFFVMHDLVHDLARAVLADKVNKEGNVVGSSCHYALLTDCSKPLQIPVSSTENTSINWFLSLFQRKSSHYALLTDCSRPSQLPVRSTENTSFNWFLNLFERKSSPYALLTDCSKPLQIPVSSTENTGFGWFFNLFRRKSSPENIKALHFVDCGNIELCGVAFSPAKCLLVLDLSECFIQELPASIGQLKQLQYLRAPCINDWMIPDCITKLSELKYFSLRGSQQISELPASIGDMKGLMHMDLSGCSGISELPISFSDLKQLVHLDLSHCMMSIPKAVGDFTKLQYLNLGLAGSFKRGSPSLTQSYLPWVGRSNKRVFPEVGNLIKLRYLNLARCLHVMDPSEDQIGSLLDSISTLSNLEHLDLSGNDLSSIPESMGNLRKLHTLDLSYCLLLKELPASIIHMGSLKVLKVETHVTLDESVLSRFNILRLPHFLVHASSDKCSSNIFLLQPTNPVELMLDRLENVKSAEEAHSIKLIEKKKIEELTFQWTVAAERIVDDKEVLEKLVPPSSVQKLSIAGYMSVNVPDWLMSIRRYLPNIYKIDLCDFPNCNNLSPLGELPNLKWLSLCRMKGLEEWNTAYIGGGEGKKELLFPKLEKLTIKHCSKLRIKPCLPRATWSYIVDSDNVLSSSGQSSSCSGASSSSAVIELNVEDSRLPLHQWSLIHQLPALCMLNIIRCSDLTASPFIIQQLSSLQSLTLAHNDHTELPSWLVGLTALHTLILYECRSMTSLPQWLGNITSLSRLEISYCEGIKSLPDSIQQLTSLEHLEIRGCCLALKEWCESEDNKMKLAHIRQKIIRRAKAYKEDTFVQATNNVDTASGSKIYNKGKKPVNTEETIDLIAEETSEYTIAEVLYSAVMDMRGFSEEALLCALSHLVDNVAQGSAYMGMQEEQRESWVMNFLIKHYQV